MISISHPFRLHLKLPYGAQWMNGALGKEIWKYLKLRGGRGDLRTHPRMQKKSVVGRGRNGSLQRSAKRLVRGCKKFVPALAYLFCPALPGSCLARFTYFLADLCTFVQFISHYSLHHCFSSVVQFSSSLSLFNLCLFILGNRNIGIVGQQACFRSVCC